MKQHAWYFCLFTQVFNKNKPTLRTVWGEHQRMIQFLYLWDVNISFVRDTEFWRWCKSSVSIHVSNRLDRNNCRKHQHNKPDKSKLDIIALMFLYVPKRSNSRSQWPLGLRRRSAAACLLRVWVWMPPGAWMSVCYECCVLSGRSFLRRADHSSREVLPTVVRRWAWSRNAMNDEALAHWGLLRQ
jgi:hypothetical protein